MPWKVSGALEQRVRFVLDHESGLYSMAELCSRFGISRQCGYKWVERYRREGLAGLQDVSRAPRHSPHRTDRATEELLIDMRRSQPTWGSRKIIARLEKMYPQLKRQLPAASTVDDLYRRSGLLHSKRRKKRFEEVVRVPLEANAPNDVWSADFKGEFRLANGSYCYPFTVSDAFSRFLIGCQGEPSTASLGVRNALQRAFHEYGLPKAIRTDNGLPFVGHGRSGLSQLSVWWIKLGIRHQRIAPGRPDQNGRHERMHRTLKAEATRPPESSFDAQQKRFDAFIREYNHERPHEALKQQTPDTFYQRSDRVYEGEVPPPDYPGLYEKRKVDGKGHLKFKGMSWFIAHPLSGETVGLVEIDDDTWAVYLYSCEIARLNPKSGKIVINVSTMSPV